MEKSIWKKEQYEVRNEELLAYTLAKIAPFEWVTITMYISDSIYTHPPIFCWRFSCEDEKIYARLKECIIKFEGNHKWEMYKGSDIGGHTKKNYTIEPRIFYEIHKNHGFGKLAEVLGSKYSEVCFKAIKDVPILCNHIEQFFCISHSKPLLPVLPLVKKSEETR